MLAKTAAPCVVALAAVLAACGQSAADKAADKVCNARDDIAKQVRELQGLTLSTATTSQVSDSLESIKKDLTTIADAQGDLADQKRKDVQAANQQFTDAVKETAGNVGKTVSLADAKTQISQQLQKLATTYRNTFGQIDCS